MNARKNLLKYHVASETIATRYHGNRVRSVRNADRWDSGKKCVRAERCYRCAQCLQAPAIVDSPSSVLLCVCNSLGSIETKRAQPSRLSRMVATSSVSPVPSPTASSTQSSSCWVGHICCRALIQWSRLSEKFVVSKIACGVGRAFAHWARSNADVTFLADYASEAPRNSASVRSTSSVAVRVSSATKASAPSAITLRWATPPKPTT
jgi:hypothetical protein